MNTCEEDLSLPRDWPEQARHAMSNALSLTAMLYARALGRVQFWQRPQARLLAELTASNQKAATTDAVLTILAKRFGRIPPQRRTHYTPMERMEILELQSLNGWTNTYTAKLFMVDENTIGAWRRELRGDSDTALLQANTPVNRFDDNVRNMVRLLRAKCPHLGKRKVVGLLLRAGYWISASTVGRISREPATQEEPNAPEPEDKPVEPVTEGAGEQSSAEREIAANYPDHVWHVDLTVVPILFGLALPFLPFSMPQCWPWAYYTMAVVDHYSRRCIGCISFVKCPTSEDVQKALDLLIMQTGAPRYIICDRGKQFDSDSFREWCEDSGIEEPRYGKAHKHGSIAVVERFIKTLKYGWTKRILISFSRKKFESLLQLFQLWYNEHRPHERFYNKFTPQEVYDMTYTPKYLQERYETRSHPSCWQDDTRPPVRGEPGIKLDMEVRFLDEEASLGTRLLPVITLQEKNAA